MKPVIICEELTFRYLHADDDSLRNASLSVQPGECVVLCGKSGSGKTSFTRLLNGLCPMFFAGDLTGKCVCDGLIAGQADMEEYVTRVGSVFQNPKTQYFNTDTTAELAFPCENVGMPPKDICKRVDSCIQRFGIGHLMNRSVFKLSGGEKQRIAFATACILEPSLLVLDEPTSNLDQEAINDLGQMIVEMKRRGTTIVLAEHRLAWLSGIADRYILFEDGSVTQSWDAEAFGRLSQEILYRKGLRATDLAPFREQNREKIMDAVHGRSPLLSADCLSIGYKKGSPVCTLSALELYPGEIVGLIGHNGVGKSTLARTLCGLQKPLSGRIQWQGVVVKARELTKHSFLVMQDVNYQLFADSVREEVLLGAACPEECDAILSVLGLDTFAERHPMSLSGGQKQRVAIAVAMLSGKELILLDEPTSGLDHHHMMQVGQLMRQLRDQGKCVLVITHDEELTAKWCDRIVSLENAGGEYGISQ